MHRDLAPGKGSTLRTLIAVAGAGVGMCAGIFVGMAMGIPFGDIDQRVLILVTATAGLIGGGLSHAKFLRAEVDGVVSRLAGARTSTTGG